MDGVQLVMKGVVCLVVDGIGRVGYKQLEWMVDGLGGGNV